MTFFSGIRFILVLSAPAKVLTDPALGFTIRQPLLSLSLSPFFGCLSQFLPKVSNSAPDFEFVPSDIFLIFPRFNGTAILKLRFHIGSTVGKLCFEGMKKVPYVDAEKSEQTSFKVVFDKLVKELREPVEFELPDWFNKWKSTSYTSIKRNIYHKKKVRKKLDDDDDGIFCSCTPSAGSSSVCGKDCFCGMPFSTCSSGCKCGSSCLNKPFQSRPVKKMKLVETEKCGSGIVADEDIEQGEFVIEYVGEVIDDKEC